MKALRSIYLIVIGFLYFGTLLLMVLVRSKFQPLSKFNVWLARHNKRIFRMVGANVQIEMKEPIPTDRPLIFMANHTSLLDIPLLQMSVPGPYIGILAEPQFNYFIYGRVVRQLGHIPIDRTSVRRSLQAFQKAQDHLSQGGWIVVLPEGGRAMDGRLMSFKKLPFRFALESQADIVPMGLSGAYAMKPKHTWHFDPGKISIRFGSIISTKDSKFKNAEDLRDHVHQAIQDLLEPMEAGLL